MLSAVGVWRFRSFSCSLWLKSFTWNIKASSLVFTYCHCYKIAAIHWVVPLYIALITQSPNTSLKSCHAMAFGPVVWKLKTTIQGRWRHLWWLRQKYIQCHWNRNDWSARSLHYNTSLDDHRVFHCHCSQGLKQIIIRLCRSVYGSSLLFWNYTVNEVKSPNRLILCLLLIFQKPVIQLCLFICSFWANNWSTAIQSRCMKHDTSLCMLHSDHLWCL